MTRLKTQDIIHIVPGIEDYNRELVNKSGADLAQIASLAAGVKAGEISCRGVRVAVISMNSGQGIIGGFADSVAAITRFLGFETIVPKNSDAAGIAEAVENGAGVLMMADDNRFVAINLAKGKVADNGDATGKGYVAALELMTGGLKNKQVLVVGAGPVGIGAAFALARFEAYISVFDLNHTASVKLAQKVKSFYNRDVTLETGLENALGKHDIIVDACPAEGFIQARHLRQDSYIAAPGIPLGVDRDCLEQVSDRLVHDPLEIGVATMIFDVLKNNGR